MSGYDDRRDDRDDDDDRPRRRDDGYDGYDDSDDRPRRGGRAAAGRGKLATPGLLLILAGVVGLVFSAGTAGLMATKPNVFHDLMVDMTKKQPDTPERKKALDDLEAQKDQMRLDGPLNYAQLGVAVILNLLAVAGGVAMRGASSYGLAMTGAICGIIPVSGCCCLTLPVGIWALVVLVNPDVKAAFAARSAAPDVD